MVCSVRFMFLSSRTNARHQTGFHFEGKRFYLNSFLVQRGMKSDTVSNKRSVNAKNTVAGQDALSFSPDMSFLKISGLKEAVKEILFDFMGLAQPSTFATVLQKERKRLVSLNIQDLYTQKRLQSAGSTGFLVRGVVYHSSSLTSSSLETQKADTDASSIHEDQNLTEIQKKKLERAELAKRDWQSFVLGSHTSEKDEKQPADSTKVKISGMTVSEMEQLEGDALTSGKRSQTLGRSTPNTFTQDPARLVAPVNKQKKPEDVMGNSGGIRAKYMSKIMEKKMLAEVRRDQGKFSPQALITKKPKDIGNVAKEKGWIVSPGAPGMLRHFRERGLFQGLLDDIIKSDKFYFDDQLGNFLFDSRIEGLGSRNLRDTLEEICKKWGLKPKQVMIIVGDDKEGKKALKCLQDSKFFLCRITKKDSQLQNQISETDENSTKEINQPSTLSWYQRLAEGKLGASDKTRSKSNASSIISHFQVSSFSQVKMVIEDLNGVSYRRSTFVQSQEKHSETLPLPSHNKSS